MKEVLARLEHFVRHSVEARPQVEAEVLATTRTDHVDVPETDPVDHTQLVVFGLGEHRVDSHPQPLGEVLEPGVGRGLQDYRVLCQEDAPGFVLVPVVPALPFRRLDRGVSGDNQDENVATIKVRTRGRDATSARAMAVAGKRGKGERGERDGRWKADSPRGVG